MCPLILNNDCSITQLSSWEAGISRRKQWGGERETLPSKERLKNSYTMISSSPKICNYVKAVWETRELTNKFSKLLSISMVTDFQSPFIWWLQPWTKKMLAPWKKSYEQPTQYIKKQRHYFSDKSPSSQCYGFSNNHVWMWELDHKDSWALKKWCFWTVVLEKTLERPLDCKEIKPVNPKGNQSWILIGRTDAEAPILWPPNAKNLLIGKDPDAQQDWSQEEKRTTEDEMVGWHHWLDGPDFGQAPGVGDGQGSLACCSPWGCRVGYSWVTEPNWCPSFLLKF